MEDLDGEVEALAREARKKLDEERQQAGDEPTVQKAMESTAVDAPTDATSPAKEKEDDDDLLLRGLFALGLILGLWLVASYVVAPIVKIAAIVFVLGALAWFVWAVTGGGSGKDPSEES